VCVRISFNGHKEVRVKKGIKAKTNPNSHGKDGDKKNGKRKRETFVFPFSLLSFVSVGNAMRHLPTLTRLLSNTAIALLIHETQFPTEVIYVETARVVAKVGSVNAVVERE